MSETKLWYEYSVIKDLPPDSEEKVTFYNNHSGNIRNRNNEQQPRVGVIIPAKNEQDYLPRTLAGINQTLEDSDETVHVVVIDNNSSDATPEIANEFGANVVVESVPRVGCVRQTGLISLPDSVKIVLSTDADTLVSKNWLNKHIEILQEERVVGSYGQIDFFPDKPCLKDETFLYLYSIVSNRIHWLKNSRGYLMTGGANQGFLKEAVFKIGGYNPKIAKAEDSDLSIRLSELGEIKKVPEARVLSSGRRILQNGGVFHGLRRFGENIGQIATGQLPVDTEYKNFR